MKKSFTIALAALAFAACKPRAGEAPAMNQNAIKALGGTVPTKQFDRNFWQREHDTNSSTWQEAKRLCGQTVLADYPNCVPVTDILRADQTKKAQIAKTLDVLRQEMFGRGYEYDAVRKAWLPFREMYVKGCVYSPAFSNDPTEIGSTWKCPSGTTVPTGISDEKFGEEQSDVTR
ncbi:MAG: hypothetical protein JO121_10565 [Deltaproteobacteria bacterium]|nr:hypothetical protein [Deltaproteobacteria bacterium]